MKKQSHRLAYLWQADSVQLAYEAAFLQAEEKGVCDILVLFSLSESCWYVPKESIGERSCHF